MNKSNCDNYSYYFSFFLDANKRLLLKTTSTNNSAPDKDQFHIKFLKNASVLLDI